MDNKGKLLPHLYFFIFGATIVGETLVTSLLVARIGASALSGLYLTNGLILFLLPPILMNRIDRVNRGVLLKKSLCASPISIAVLFALYQIAVFFDFSYSHVLLYLFFPLSYLMKSVLFMIFWTVSNDLTDAHEAKTLFPEIAFVGFLGAIISSIFSRTFLAAVQPEMILLVWAVLYLFAFMYVKKMLKYYWKEFSPHEIIVYKEESPLLKPLKDFLPLFRIPIIRYISIFYYLTYVIIFLLDFYFWTQCALVFSEAKSLTSFQFSFYILYSVITIVILRYYTPSLIANHGVTTVFGLLPRFLSVALFGYFLFAFFFPESSFVFVLLLVLQVLRYVTFENFFSPVYQMFFTTIAADKRGRSKTGIEGFIKPLAIISASLLMLQVTEIVLLLLLILFALLLLYTSGKLKKAYVVSLLASDLTTGRNHNSIISKIIATDEKILVDILTKYLEHEEKDMQFLGIDLLLAINTSQSRTTLVDIIGRSSDFILPDYVSQKIESTKGENIRILVDALLRKSQERYAASCLSALTTVGCYAMEYYTLAVQYRHIGNIDQQIAGLMYLWPRASKDELVWMRMYILSLLDSDVHYEKGLLAQSLLQINSWKGNFLGSFSRVSDDALHILVPFFVKNTEEKDILDFLYLLEIDEKLLQKRVLAHMKDLGEIGYSACNEYLLNQVKGTEFADELLKKLVCCREKDLQNSVSYSEDLRWSGVHRYALRKCENAYLLAANYAQFLSLGQKYNIRSSVVALWEDALQGALNSAAETAIDALTIIEGYGYLFRSREEFRLSDKDGRISMIEILETIRESDLKDLTIPILEDSRWRVYRDVGIRFFTFEYGTFHFLQTGDFWLTLVSLFWHYDLLHDSAHEQKIKTVVNGLRNSSNETIRDAAIQVVSLWEDMKVVSDKFQVLETVLFLKKTEIFSKIVAEELLPLAEEIKAVSYAAGEVISREGDVARHLYIVRSGSIDVCKGDQNLVINSLGVGDIYGETGLFGGDTRSASAIASSDTVIYVLNRLFLKHLMERVPHLSWELLVLMGKKVRLCSDDLVQLKRKV